jgi:hypothetical protein
MPHTEDRDVVACGTNLERRSEIVDQQRRKQHLDRCPGDLTRSIGIEQSKLRESHTVDNRQ